MPAVSTGTPDTHWIKNPLRNFGWFSMKILTWSPILLSFAACEINLPLNKKKDAFLSKLSFQWLSLCLPWVCCAGSSIQYLLGFLCPFPAS